MDSNNISFYVEDSREYDIITEYLKLNSESTFGTSSVKAKYVYDFLFEFILD